MATIRLTEEEAAVLAIERKTGGPLAIVKGRAASSGEEVFALHCRLRQIPEPEREYRFHPERRWRFDFAWPKIKLAAEIEGGTWKNGRHNRHKGFEGDCEKYNEAAILGWTVLRFTTQQVKRGYAIDALMRWIKAMEVAA